VLLGYFNAAGHGPIGMVHSVLMVGLWVLFVVVAWGIFRVTRWGFFLCIVAAVSNSLFSMVLYSVGDSGAGPQEYLSFNPFQFDTLINLVFFLPVVIVLRDKIMAPFFNPRLKWWEQHQRVKAFLRIEATIAGQPKSYQSFDISESGMFLGTQELPKLVVGDTFPASIHLEDMAMEVEVLCKTVWISDGTGRAPVGCGVTFDYRKKRQKRALGLYIKAKIREGHLLERT